MFLTSNVEGRRVYVEVLGLAGSSEHDLKPSSNPVSAELCTGSNGHFTGSIILPESVIDEWRSRSQEGTIRKGPIKVLLKAVAEATLTSRPSTSACGWACRRKLMEMLTGRVVSSILISSTGISVVSDVDDTIKESNINLGFRKILSTAFLEQANAVDGMSDVYRFWVCKS